MPAEPTAAAPVQAARTVVIHYEPSANRTARLEIEMRVTKIYADGDGNLDGVRLHVGEELVPAADPTALAAQLIANGAIVTRIAFA